MTNEVSFCQLCGAEIVPGKPCWLCQSDTTAENVFTQPLEDGDADSVTPPVERHSESKNPYEPPVPIGETPGASTATFVLVVGMIIVLGALTVAAPGLGVLLSIFVAPALIRTAVVVGRRKRIHNRLMSTSEKSVLFMASFGGVLLAATAAAVAFGVTCAATCFGVVAVAESSSGQGIDALILASIVLSSAIGLGAFGYTLHRLWRKKT